MEIQQLRKEFNQLLDKINQQSERFTDEAHLPSLEVSVMMSKINKLQEVTAVLKYATEHMEGRANQKRKIFDAQLNEDRLEASNAIKKEQEEQKAAEEIVLDEPEIEAAIPEKLVPVQELPKTEKKPESSLGDKFLETPIASLKDAFSLNDRYLFANELFKKDMALFNEMITKLDNCNNIEEAMLIVEKASSALNWDLESENVLSLHNKVQRRFIG